MCKFRVTLLNILSFIVLGLMYSNIGIAWADDKPNASAAVFFSPAKESGKELPPDNVYPQGRKFPITIFSVGGNTSGAGALPEQEKQRIMNQVAGDGFTMFGPQYELNDRVMRDAKQHGVKAVYMINPGWTKQMRKREPNQLKALTSTQIASAITRQVKDALNNKDSDAIAWWYLVPEELRPWKPEEMRYLKIATDTIRKIDPEHRPIWMYDPGHRNAEHMKAIAARVDILGKGMYTNYSSMINDRVWCRWSIEQERKAIADAKSNAVPIAVPEMFRHPGVYDEKYLKDENSAVKTIKNWVRHDAYAALIAGAKGMAIFSLRQRINDTPQFSGKIHEAYYQGYAQVANELNGTLGLGEVFLFGEPRDDVHVEVIEGPEVLTLEYRNNPVKTYPSIGLANIAVGQVRYIILVNSSKEYVSAIVSGLPSGGDVDVQDLFGNKELCPTDGEITLHFKPYEVSAYKICMKQNKYSLNHPVGQD